jgi:HEAT repeat protein
VAVEPLLKAVSHPDPVIRRSALTALARIDDLEDPGPVFAALNDEAGMVRNAALTTLIAHKGVEAVPDIRFLLKDADERVRSHVIVAIGDLGDESLADLIMPFIEGDLDVVKVAALRALSRMKSRGSAPIPQTTTYGENTNAPAATALRSSPSGGKN